MEPTKTSTRPWILWLGLASVFIALIIFLKNRPEKVSTSAPEQETEKASRSKQPELSLLAENLIEEEAEAVFKEALSDTDPSLVGFLETGYIPLSNWMSESFEVKYSNMTPDLIFNQVPLNDIHYEVGELSPGKVAFDYEASSISRRELLKKIADLWDVSIEYTYGADGNPTAVKVFE